MSAEAASGIDLELLRLLAADGKAKLAELAQSTGLSTSAVQARVRRLEENGSIRGYRADIDPAALGTPLLALVEIEAPRSEPLTSRLLDDDAVVSCWSVAGGGSHVALVRVAGLEELEELLQRHSGEGAARLRSSVVLRTLR